MIDVCQVSSFLHETLRHLYSNESHSTQKKNVSKSVAHFIEPVTDNEALELIKKFDAFAGKTPTFITYQGILAQDNA